MKVTRKCSFALLILISGSISILLCEKAYAWKTEGRWSTAKFNCSGKLVKIGVDMKSRIGGGDASPVRNAYMAVNGKTMEAAWIVGASMDSVETNNRDYTLVTNSSSGTYLQSIGVKDKQCFPIR